MAVVLVFAIGLLTGSTSVTGARVRLNAGETGAPDSASAFVETNLEGGCSLHNVRAAKQALKSGLIPALIKVKGMEKVKSTWTVNQLWHQSRTAFDKACTRAMRAECEGMGKVCVNYDGPGGYQTTGQCVKDGEWGSLLETEAGEAEVAIQGRQGQSLESGSSVACPTSLSTAEAYLADLVPSLQKVSGFEKVGNTWSIKQLLTLALKFDDQTCKNPANEQKCSKQGKYCVDVDGPGGYLTSHACMACGEWGNPYC